MAVYTRPGVYVQETLNPIAPTPGVASLSIAAFIGTSDRGPTSAATLVTSWSQYVSKFGGWNTISNNNLPIAVYLFFANGGTQAYITRVLGNTTSAVVTAASWTSASGGTVTYTANNTFTSGQTVTVTGLANSAWNVSGATIATATSTYFTVTGIATATNLTGVTATATAITGYPTVATRTLSDRAGSPLPTLTIASNNSGTWGNSLYIAIQDSLSTGYFNVIVYLGGTTSGYIVEQWTDVTMKSTDARYAVTVINQNSAYITATDLLSTSGSPTSNPAVTGTNTNLVPVVLSGGSDNNNVSSANISSALSLFDTIASTLILNIPGFTDVTTVNLALAYATGSTRSNDVFVIIDGINDTATNQLALAATYSATSSGAVYYPQITISDPTAAVGSPTGATKTVGAGGAVAGLFARTDASRGVFKAPAGLQARLSNVVSVPSLSTTDLGNLNNGTVPVNAIRYITGSGFVVMGARTLKQGYVDKYVPVRRTLTYLEKSLSDLTQFAIFEPNNQVLWNRINSVVGNFLNQFWGQGGLFGNTPSSAFFVKCDSDVNPQPSIDNGFVNIQVGVSLQRPAEFIIINIGQFNGGTTVTTA